MMFLTSVRALRPRSWFFYVALVLGSVTQVLTSAQAASVYPTDAPAFTWLDSLRGSNTPERAWWDVIYYDLNVTVDPAGRSVRGYNAITYKVVGASRDMQIDLQVPLEIDSVVQDGVALQYRRELSVYWITPVAAQANGAIKTVTVYYHGKPRAARNAPWDGGFVWAKDQSGAPWVATAVQGLGASAWWPNKDYQGEEPDSQRIAITVPNELINVSNGRLRSTTPNADSTTTYEWFVTSPINNYTVSVNSGKYAHFSDVYEGENGKLTLDFWPLAENLEKAKVQFQQAKLMLKCFEHWFGPYPWYADGFKLVETPFLGMEHQSAVAYGNKYANGYLGKDMSESGWGLKWDFIIVHESGHEWFGNHITTQDVADMWIHEGFTTYSEALFTECEFGKDAGSDYAVGIRKRIRNDRPIIGKYGVNQSGSGDMYFKGANVIHTIRQVINDDEKFRQILRGMQATFGRKTITGQQIQEYINTQSGINFDKVFEQYLTTTRIPVFEWKIVDGTLSYRWANVISGFDMPVRVTTSPDKTTLLKPTETWQTLKVDFKDGQGFSVDRNFYVMSKQATE